MAASQWPYTKTNLTNCALQCPTYDKKTNSILAFCENDNTCYCIKDYYFQDKEKTKCVHLYTNLTWPYFVQYCLFVPCILYYAVVILQTSKRKSGECISSLPQHKLRTNFDYVKAYVCGNFAIRSINLLFAYCICKLLHATLFLHIPAIWSEVLKTSSWIAIIVTINLFYQFGRITNKMSGKGSLKRSQSFGNIIVGGIPLVNILRKSLFCFTLFAFICANVSTLVVETPIIVKNIFTQYLIGLYGVIAGGTCRYYARTLLFLLFFFKLHKHTHNKKQLTKYTHTHTHMVLTL